MGLLLLHVGLLFLMFSAFSCSVRSEDAQDLFVQNPDSEWERMETEIHKEVMPARAPKRKLGRGSVTGQQRAHAPGTHYLIVSGANEQNVDFEPGQGARPLPSSAAGILLGHPPNALQAERIRDPKRLVEILCHVDRMYVRIKREVFKTVDAYKYLKLGTCPVNAATGVHYYLLYLLVTDCGFKQESKPDFVHISNALTYEPTTPVVREMPFTIPLLCKYPRYFYSYQTGFHPKLQGGTIFKPLDLMNSLTLTAQDAMGNAIPGSKTYTMGELMYFEAKQPQNSGQKRLYINKCFVTASPNPTSSPSYTLIDNQGCMIDGKVSATSAFLTGASKTSLRFRVTAFIFKDAVSSSSSTQKLYMHCEIAVGPQTATPALKACNYDAASAAWKGLYDDDDSVCTCCNSTCPSVQPRASKRMTLSNSWNVDLSEEEAVETLTGVSLEDPYSPAQEDFLTYWEHDFQK
ncbi:zona pellucida sperm-binding protein 3 [Betta splendens]|uniref:Zona pellucida sperm-binding protein 3 n=1 Tax=Betta splendens TaxID=158456 RepID=A0A6P7NG41_BETSP|nr:zona pellucida sperm-binding protein 3 [Betta splendens]